MQRSHQDHDLSCRQHFDRMTLSPVQVYTIYSILSLVFVILIIVTAFITIALTYFQLAVEDHGWWWRSFLCGGSTGAVQKSCPSICHRVSDNSSTAQSTSRTGAQIWAAKPLDPHRLAHTISLPDVAAGMEANQPQCKHPAQPLVCDIMPSCHPLLRPSLMVQMCRRCPRRPL